MKRDENKKGNRILRKAIIILFWLLVWQLLALFVGNEILLVTPWRVVGRFVELLADFAFWQTVLYSLCRIGLGFLLGTGMGLLLAALGSRFPLLEEVLNPLMTLCKTVPVASFVVLLLIWWGSEYLAVSICFLIVLPNIYINTLEGIRSTDKRLLEMAEVFHMPLKNRFFYIYRPALKPFLDSSLKLSLGMCWKSGVAAEVIGTPKFSIGERLYLSKIHLDTAGVFAWTAVIILLSVCFEKLILWLVEKFFEWEPACRKASAVEGDYKKGEYHEKQEYHKQNECREADGRNGGNCHDLQISHLNKKFDDKRLFSDFSETYKMGKAYYINSPSGSGKTTFFRMLCGLEKADGGSIEPDFRYSVMFQEDRLCEEYSALRNVEMILGDREKARKALLAVLEEEAIHKPCRQLSGGMKRRVALVRAMEAESDCILLDEPFTGLDWENRAIAEKYIIKKQQGRILLIATHI